MSCRTIGHYEILRRKIGAGGSGVVYLANDTLLQRPVVLKLLKRGVDRWSRCAPPSSAKLAWPPPSTIPTFAPSTMSARRPDSGEKTKPTS